MFMHLGIFLSLLSTVASYNSPQFINYMTNKHHKLVPYYGTRYLKKVYIPQEDKKDIIQEGYIGLYYAARKYDTTRNISFSYYSKFWIMRYFNVALQKYSQEKKFNFPLKEYQIIPIKDNTDYIDLFTHMQKLSPYHQDILYRRYIKYEKVKDLAVYYHVSRNTMTNHIYLALHYLRILYGAR